MSDETIPEDVHEFVLRYINSVAQLEALLLLWRDPNRAWNVASLAKRLYIEEGETSEVLAQLNADGLLLTEQGDFRFNGADWQETVGRLAESYAKHLIPITNIIHAKPRRIREFADAFKFRKGR
jgi:hypothetical protein